MKFELIASFDEGSTEFSIASFNNMKHSLCQSFGIVNEEQEALHSGCTGFGIDRWVYGFALLYGSDAKEWPEDVINQLKEWGEGK
ncbi:Amino acid--[acyl-carrier-protein] ligase [compost metagenome]